MQETLFHSYSDNVCAYCQLHDCGVTAKQMRKKQCHHLQKNENHPVWRQRERIKALRKDRKQTLTYIC